MRANDRAPLLGVIIPLYVPALRLHKRKTEWLDEQRRSNPNQAIEKTEFTVLIPIPDDKSLSVNESSVSARNGGMPKIF